MAMTAPIPLRYVPPAYGWMAGVVALAILGLGMISGHIHLGYGTDSFIDAPISTENAVYSQNVIWYLRAAPYNEASQLLRIDPASGRSTNVTTGIELLGLVDGHVYALRRGTPGEDVRQLWLYSGPQPRLVASTRFTADDFPTTIFGINGQAAVLSSRSLRILDSASRNWRMLQLSRPLAAGVATSVAVAQGGAVLYAGINIGEFGGGLWRVDVRSGEVQPIENEDGEICESTLDVECSPINAVLADPKRSECVYAAVGLVHLGSIGRVIRACPSGSTTVLRHDITWHQEGQEYTSPEPFFGLATDGSAILAGGAQAVYRIDNGRVTRTELPQPSQSAEFPVVRFGPDLVLLWTQRNGPVAMGWNAPIYMSTH